MSLRLSPKAAEAAFRFLEGRLRPARTGAEASPSLPSAHAWLPGRHLQVLTAALPSSERRRYGLDGAAGALTAALAFSEGLFPLPDDLGSWASGPRGGLGRFARANWYEDLVGRLGGLARACAADLWARGLDAGGKGEWRPLANSSLPERSLALAAGLGSLGRNNLLITPSHGPGVILGVLLLPFDPEPFLDAPPPRLPLPEGGPSTSVALHPACAGCGACVEACPTGALESGPQGSFRRDRCLQHWTTRPEAPPEDLRAVWGRRIYGCDTCLEACPLFRPGDWSETVLGRLGPGLPLAWLLETEPRELSRRLKGTALGLGWMDPQAWIRNARLASGLGDLTGQG